MGEDVLNERAIKEIQTFCKEHTERTRKQLEIMNERLAQGNERFSVQEYRIMEIEKDYVNLCGKFAIMSARLNQILGSVVVACILLAINIMLGTVQ